ncbi:TSUP family transporter [Alphaproteobacteria bacterium GH1-50]|uniref:Probable membrane transporter protein n=1 Tax=Kangsaoukella pontilimi TaxID=2691042 RepID=A0A7C9MGP1_9RHOB|nr:sulfite exporter TauE/SafE family protein [Kangsaoukella pontilimi]MXQ09672.1 TSUP family transporter [Kangsaoukella pontilimi]
MAVPAVIFAGISKAGFGSGAAFAAAPFLALILEPEQAIGLMLPLLMLMDVLTLRPYWRQWDAGATRLLILGGLPGVALGAAFWSAVDEDTIRVLIGAIAIGFVLFKLLGTNLRLSKDGGPMAGLVAGVAAGFTSFVSHAGGPPATVYLLSKGMGKTEYQATTVIVFWVINLAKAVPYGILGMITVETLRAGLFLIPAAVVGVWLGVVAHRSIPERAFFAVTYILLVTTGTKLIWDALT